MFRGFIVYKSSKFTRHLFYSKTILIRNKSPIWVFASLCYHCQKLNLACSLFSFLVLRSRARMYIYILRGFHAYIRARYFPCIYKVCSERGRQRERERNTDRDRTRAKAPPRDHTLKTHIYVLRGGGTYTFSYQYRQTARPIYSTTLFSTASLSPVHSTPRSFRSPLHELPSPTLDFLVSRFREKKIFLLPSYCFFRRKCFLGKRSPLGPPVKVKKAPRRSIHRWGVPLAPVTPLLRPWRDTSCVRNIASRAAKSQYVHVRRVASCLCISPWKIPSCTKEIPIYGSLTNPGTKER